MWNVKKPDCCYFQRLPFWGHGSLDHPGVKQEEKDDLMMCRCGYLITAFLWYLIHFLCYRAVKTLLACLLIRHAVHVDVSWRRKSVVVRCWSWTTLGEWLAASASSWETCKRNAVFPTKIAMHFSHVKKVGSFVFALMPFLSWRWNRSAIHVRLSIILYSISIVATMHITCGHWAVWWLAF